MLKLDPWFHKIDGRLVEFLRGVSGAWDYDNLFRNRWHGLINFHHKQYTLLRCISKMNLAWWTLVHYISSTHCLALYGVLPPCTIHHAPSPEMVRAKSSPLGRPAIFCKALKLVDRILRNIAPSHPIVLRMLPNSSTCFLPSLNTSPPKLVRGKLA